MFLWLPTPDLAVERVARRVKQGGHHIPEDTIRRRYYAGLKNLIKHYLPISDKAIVLDNSIAGLNKVIARKSTNNEIKIEEPMIWEEIQGIAQCHVNIN